MHCYKTNLCNHFKLWNMISQFVYYFNIRTCALGCGSDKITWNWKVGRYYKAYEVIPIAPVRTSSIQLHTTKSVANCAPVIESINLSGGLFLNHRGTLWFGPSVIAFTLTSPCYGLLLIRTLNHLYNYNNI